MKKVYRYELDEVVNSFGGEIENPGPYTAQRGGTGIFGDKEGMYIELYESMCRKHNRSSHPTKGEDNIGFDEDIFCACPSLEQLKNWFKGYNRKLIDIGFNLVEYRVKTFVMGDSGKQVGFKREHVVGKKILA